MGRKINALKASNYAGKLVFIFKFPVKPEKRSMVLDMFKPHAEISRKEPGCSSYSFHQDFMDQNVIWLKEEWDNLDSVKSRSKAYIFSSFLKTSILNVEKRATGNLITTKIWRKQLNL